MEKAIVQNKVSPNLSFYKTPFVYIFCFYFFGTIYAQHSFSWNSALYFFLFSILFISIELNFRILVHRISSLVFPFVFFSAGYIGNGLFIEANYSKSLHANEISKTQLRITEISNTRNNNWKGIAQLEKTSEQNVAVHEKIVFYAKRMIPLHVGDVVVSNTKFNAFKNSGNPGEFNTLAYWKSKGIRFYTFLEENNTQIVMKDQSNVIDKLLHRSKKLFTSQLEAHLEGEYLSIAKALILGDKSMLNDETKETFSKTGAMHLLAVSGLHIGLILLLIIRFFSLFSRFISKNAAMITSIFFLWIYAFLTGASPSVVRAVFMFSMLTITQLTGKNYNPINTLFFTALLFIIVNPNCWLDISFQLSFSAMFGIYLLYWKIENLLAFKRKILRYFWQGIALCLSAQIFTFPIALFHFHTFPNYFVLSNIVLIAISGILLGLGVILVLFSSIPYISILVSKLFILLLFTLLVALGFIEHLPFATASGYVIFWWMIPTLPVLISLLLFTNPYGRKWTATILVLLPLLFWMCHIRFQNLGSKHVVFFNNKNILIGIKINDRLLCLTEHGETQSFQTKNILENYRSVYPCELSFVEMDSLQGYIQFGRHEIAWNKLDRELDLRVDQNKYSILYSSLLPSKNQNEQIFMPWIHDQKSLAHGAKFYPLD